jgi:hypothetical protein
MLFYKDKKGRLGCEPITKDEQVIVDAFVNVIATYWNSKICLRKKSAHKYQVFVNLM